MNINTSNIVNKLAKKTDISNSVSCRKSVKSPDECSLGIDISSRSEFPYNVLSNFSPTNFVFDGVQINSIEGFLQSLKISNPEVQKEVCSMSGIKAKGIGKKINKKRNYDFKHLYWQGKHISRLSPEYTELLKRVYSKRFSCDENFRFALEYTENRILKHSIGEKDKTRTLLTEDEFIEILYNLRKSIKS